MTREHRRRSGVTDVAVIGTGYVGLTSGACLAHLGHDVVCADVDPAKVARLGEGGVEILEKGLEELVREGLRNERLRFVSDNREAVAGAEFVFLCLPTPRRSDGSADLSYIEDVARELSSALEPDSVVVTKSTVPVGTADLVSRLIGRQDVEVVANPEFLREGSAVHDFLNPDRIVIGAADQAAAMRVAALYLGAPAPLIVTDTASAETVKYASNAFLATKVSFVNAIAAVCEAVGADVSDVVLGMGHDPRIGFHSMRPGPGWGGSCLPKDTRALIHLAREAGYDFALLEGVVEVNEEQFDRVAAKVADAVGGDLSGVRVAAWGLTFKAGTNDLRESPALEILGRLRAGGATVRAHDPALELAGDGAVTGAAADHLDGIAVCNDPYAACEGADVLVVLTEWDGFRWLDFDKVAELMARRHVVDARNLLDRPSLLRRGFTYTGLGRT